MIIFVPPPDEIYIVMEYLGGGSLRDFLRYRTAQGMAVRQRGKRRGRGIVAEVPGRVTGRDMYHFAIDVARGMEYLSDHGVSSGDMYQ